MRISDWSSDVCSSDLRVRVRLLTSTAFLERFHEDQRHDAGKFSTRYRTAKLTVPELGVSRLGSVPAAQSTLGIASDAALQHLDEQSCAQPQMLTMRINDTDRLFRDGGRLAQRAQCARLNSSH